MFRLSKHVSKLLVMFFTLPNSCCTSGSVSRSSVADSPQDPSPIPSPVRTSELSSYVPDQFGERIGDFIKTYTGEGTLSYMGYEIVKSKRKSTLGRSKSVADIEYAELRRGGRTIAGFDSSVDQLSEIRFGLVSFLEHDTKQLIVEQTSDRFWRYWIVSLKPEFMVIYDSGKYNIAFELRAADIDGDGQLEIIQNLASFWFFDSLDNVYSPHPEIIFKYEPRVGRYVPANPQFRDVALKDLDQRIAKTRQVIERRGDPRYDVQVRSAVLDVVLRYLYAGKSNEGWSFYEQEYNLTADKKSVRSEIREKLRTDKVYQEIDRRLRAER
jgi:hypothetical protein